MWVRIASNCSTVMIRFGWVTTFGQFGMRARVDRHDPVDDSAGEDLGQQRVVLHHRPWRQLAC
jgi:hypothetical protein